MVVLFDGFFPIKKRIMSGKRTKKPPITPEIIAMNKTLDLDSSN